MKRILSILFSCFSFAAIAATSYPYIDTFGNTNQAKLLTAETITNLLNQLRFDLGSSASNNVMTMLPLYPYDGTNQYVFDYTNSNWKISATNDQVNLTYSTNLPSDESTVKYTSILIKNDTATNVLITYNTNWTILGGSYTNLPAGRVVVLSSFIYYPFEETNVIIGWGTDDPSYVPNFITASNATFYVTYIDTLIATNATIDTLNATNAQIYNIGIGGGNVTNVSLWGDVYINGDPLDMFNFDTNLVQSMIDASGVGTTNLPTDGAFIKRTGDTNAWTYDASSLSNVLSARLSAETGAGLADTNFVLRQVGNLGFHVFSSGVTNNSAVASRTNLWQGLAVVPSTATTQTLSGLTTDAYVRHVVSTNVFYRVEAGPVTINTYLYKSVAGSVSIHPEIYLYDTVSNSLTEIGSDATQPITATTPTLYTFSISVDSYILTNATKIVWAWKIDSVGASPSLSFVSGGNYDSHLSFVQNVANITLGPENIQGTLTNNIDTTEVRTDDLIVRETFRLSSVTNAPFLKTDSDGYVSATYDGGPLTNIGQWTIIDTNLGVTINTNASNQMWFSTSATAGTNFNTLIVTNSVQYATNLWAGPTNVIDVQKARLRYHSYTPVSITGITNKTTTTVGSSLITLKNISGTNWTLTLDGGFAGGTRSHTITNGMWGKVSIEYDPEGETNYVFRHF